MALLGPERRRPTVFYSSSFAVWHGLVGSGAGPRRSRRCPLSHCQQGGASAEPAMSSASLLVGRGLGGAGGVLCLVVGAAGPRRSRRCPLPRCWHRVASAEQGLVDASGAGTRRSRH